jgi:hypothetical protein
MRKTIKVEAIIDLANKLIEQSPKDAKLDRLHMADFVSCLLLNQNCYKGFNYLEPYRDNPDCDTSRIFFYK